MVKNLKILVRGAYDIQKLRIQMGNRIVANFKTKLGQESQKPETSLTAEGKMILVQLRGHFKKITDGIKTFPRHSSFKGDSVISDYTELCLLSQYTELEKQESDHFKRMGSILKDYPIFTEFLEGVAGVGPAMAGVIISEMEPRAAKYPSSFWKYAGLDVGPDGMGRNRRKEHLVESEYTDAEGEIKTKMGITFNPWLKTKLVGVLGSSFLRAKDSYYGKSYYEYKARLENTPAHAEKTKGHRHNMAMRYMIKRFLVDLHMAWRKIEGLEVSTEYSEGKLGMKHGK